MKTFVVGLMAVMALHPAYLTTFRAQDVKAQDEDIILAEGTTFNIVTTEEISSKKAKLGDSVVFKVDEDVKVKDQVLISKGTLAKGIVVNAEKSGRMGKAGKLGIKVETTTTVDGQPVKLRATQGKEGDDKTNSVTALSILVSSLFLLKKGEDAKIKAGERFKVYVGEEKRFRLVGSSLVAQEPPALNGTSAESASTENKASEGFATVYIFRPSKLVGKALEPSVFCDGVELGRMDNGRYLMLKLKPGKHVVHMTDQKKGFEVDMGGGQEYYFRVGIEMGMWKGHGKLMLVDNEKGAAEVKKLKPLGRDKIKDQTMVVAEANPPK
ncbi:MAG TPA: DUF2846 domain-containing protein [Pyrinomonadaceae bacterium]|jgi:hypothetical protein